MKNEDRIIKYLAYDGKVSISCINSSYLLQKAREIHDLTPTTTAILGRVMSIACMMGADLKSSDDNLTIQIKGNGPAGNVVVVANNFPKVKGYVQNPHLELPLSKNGKIDVGTAVGHEGSLIVIKDIGLKEPYIGIVPLISGEIAEDFTKYFADSEQKPTAIALGVLVNNEGVKASGGYMLNLMPDATDEIITKIEQNISKIPSMTKMLDEGLSLTEIAKKVTGDNNIKIIEENIIPVYECDCSKERFEKGLLSLGKEDLNSILNTDQQIETVCNFCNKKYVFDKEYLKELIKN